MEKTLSGLVALIALGVVEHNGVKYGPGLPDGVAFKATPAEAKALIMVGSAKAQDEEDLSGANSGETSVVLSQARAAIDAAAVAQAQADAAAQAAADAQAKANADADSVAQERAKLEADMKSFAEARAAAEAQAAEAPAVAASKKK